MLKQGIKVERPVKHVEFDIGVLGEEALHGHVQTSLLDVAPRAQGIHMHLNADKDPLAQGVYRHTGELERHSLFIEGGPQCYRVQLSQVRGSW